MAGAIKGLTVEIGGDTTKLGQALENVNKKSRDLSKELGDINRLLKMDPGNADLLAQKQKVLADAVETTRDKLDKLKQAEAQVQQQFARGEVSEEQYRALQREVVATEQKLKGYERAAKETADAVDKVGDKTKAAAEKSEAMDKVSSKVATGLKAVGAAAAAAVTALVAMAEASREYRTYMGMLATAFEEQGFSADQAKTAYRELVGVLGDADQATEATNHLAKLVTTEQDLATWTGDILPGVWATFGKSLPIEGLTEAANETAKVGQVTGPLADALNWAGVSEDVFNESLAACTTEQERAALITQTLNDLYGDASETYKETNADVIAANQANDDWAASMAAVGAEIEPIVTEVKTVGAELLGNLVPAIQWVKDNLPYVAAGLGAVAAGFVAFKVAQLAATAATNGMTLAQYAAAAAKKALDTAMNAGAIGLIVTAIGLLVTAFIYLWNNCEEFRNFWIELWKSIKTAFAATVDWLGQAAQNIGAFFVAAWESISGAFASVGTWFSEKFTAAKDGIVQAWADVGALFSDIWGKIKSAFNLDEIFDIGTNLVTGLWKGISGSLTWIKDKITGWVGDVLDFIKKLFGIASPSKEMAWIGDMLDQGLAQGMEAGANAPVRAMAKVTQGVLGAAEGVNGLTLDRQLQSTFGGQPVGVVADTELISRLDRILGAIESGRILTIDGDALVGATVGKYDKALGQRRALAARGAI